VSVEKGPVAPKNHEVDQTAEARLAGAELAEARLAGVELAEVKLAEAKLALAVDPGPGIAPRK